MDELPPSSRAHSGLQWLVRLRDCSTNGEESRKAFALESRFLVHTRRLQTMTTVKFRTHREGPPLTKGSVAWQTFSQHSGFSEASS